MWILHRQQQQCGAQMPARADKARLPGEVPAEAVADRSAQEHDRTGGAVEPGAYPASALENRGEDTAVTEASVAWDEVIQPEPRSRAPDDLPLPEGK